MKTFCAGVPARVLIGLGVCLAVGSATGHVAEGAGLGAALGLLGLWRGRAAR